MFLSFFIIQLTWHYLSFPKHTLYFPPWYFCSLTYASIAFYSFGSVQLHSRVRLFATPRTAARQASLSITSTWNLLKLMSIETVTPSNCLILCRPLLLPSIFPSIIIFSNESAFCIRWPKYGSFSSSISPSNEY